MSAHLFIQSFLSLVYKYATDIVQLAAVLIILRKVTVKFIIQKC